MTERCEWCQDGGMMEKYHDEEWGVPLHDDQKQFEFLMMEAMQCGLSWNLMLKKREIFRQCFDNFDYKKIAQYDDTKIQEIMDTPGMIRSIRKIQAIINNANVFQRIIEEFGSFDAWLWGYTQGKTRVYKHHQSTPAARNELSDAIGRELKKRGFKYLGSITVYAHLQACGIINDHECRCFRYADICANYPVEFFD